MSASLLQQHLTAVREHALSAVDGLDDATLRRALLPSGWSFLGMVKHLTYDEERFWFSCVVAGDPDRITELDQLRGQTWTVPDDVPAETIIDDYRASIATSDAIIAATPLDAAPAWWPGDLFGDWRLHTLEEVLLHMITEVACHAGHLDAARELVDGRQWLVLTD